MATKKDKKKKAEKSERLSARKMVEKQLAGSDYGYLSLPKGVTLYSPKPGRHKLDFLPFIAGEGNPVADKGKTYFERTFYIHRNVGPDNKKEICPKRTANKKCPICEFADKIRNSKSSDDDMIAQAKALRPSERQLFALIDQDQDDKGVQVWDISTFLWGDMLSEEIDDDNNSDEPEGHEFFADGKEGFTVEVKFKEDSFDGRKYVKPSKIIGFEPRDPIDPKILEEVPCLDDMVKPKSYEELKKLFLQEDTGDDEEEEDEDLDEEDEEEDEDESPKSKKSSKTASSKKSSKASDDDEDDDDEEEEEEDDDEEEEPPKSSKGKGKKDSPLKAKDADLSIGDEVTYTGTDKKIKAAGKKGAFEIINVSKDGTSLTLEDQDGNEFKGVGCAEVAKVEEEDDDEEEAPKSSKSSKKSSKAKDDDEDGDDDDDGDEDDDEEDDDSEEEEDEDDDWDDEEEEEAPKSKKKSGKKK